MLSVKQCAARACVCESLVRGWIAAGRLPHYRLGLPGKRGKIAVAVEDLDGLLASFRVGVKSPVPEAAPKPVAMPAAAQVKLKHLRLP